MERRSLGRRHFIKDDGYVYGRRAIDFKGGLAVFTQAVLDIVADVKAGKLKLARDIILLVEADENGLWRFGEFQR